MMAMPQAHGMEGGTPDLSMALFARNIIETLLQFVEEDRTENLEQSLNEAIKALSAATHTSFVADEQRHSRAVSTYEQALVLKQAWPEDKRQAMIETLNTLKSEARDKEIARTQAVQAIEFFLALESRGVKNFFQAQASTMTL